MTQKKQPRTEIMTITPERAMELLDKYSNGRNPPIRQGNIDRYAKDMKAKDWKLNGEPIILGFKSILDGHHRLWACTEAAVPFTTLVVSDVDDDTFDTIDTGRTRTWADAIFIDGVKTHHRPAATAVGLILRYEAGKIVTNAKIANHEIQTYVSGHPDLMTWVEASSKGSMRPYAAPIAAVTYLAAGKYRARAVDFIDKLVHGAGLQKGDPTLALRNRLLDKGRRSLPTERLALVIQGWNAYVEGRTLTRMQIYTGDKFPKIKGATR